MSNFTKEQKSCVEHNEGNILVSASAGSGKTYVMISRIIRLIKEKKAGVKNILAITFTSAAAQEMKEKLNKALIELAIETGDDYIKSQLKLLSEANISTIHAFCADVLRSYFYEADIDANFEILDKNDTVILKNQAINELFEEKYENSDHDFLMLVKRFIKYRSDNILKKTVISIYDKLSSDMKLQNVIDNAEIVYTKDNFDSILKELESIGKEKLILLKCDLTDIRNEFSEFKSEKHTVYLDTIIEFIDLKLKLESEKYYAVNMPLQRVPALTKAEKEYLSSSHEKLKSVKDSLTKFIKAENTFYENFDYEKEYDLFLKSKDTAINLSALVNEFRQRYTALKDKDSKCDYDDLQQKTLKLLQNKQILASLREKFKYVFTDEYQDVNDLQESLLNLLSKDNLFMVGDLKQSIYAFRGCNPEFFANKYHDYFNGHGTAEKLNDNFRSSDGVIDGVNIIFNRIMTTNTAGLDYKNESQLNKGGLYPENEGGVFLHTYENPKKEKDFVPEIYDIKNFMNLKDKADDNQGLVIKRIIENEINSKYFDIKSNTYKNINFSDIVILSARRKNFVKISEVLIKNNIPVSTDTKDSIMDYPEIIMLTDILELMVNRQQDIPYISFLKNISGLTENELAEIRLYSKQKLYKDCCKDYAENCDDEISYKINEAEKYITKLRTLADFYPASDLLTKIITDNNLETKYLAKANGKLILKRISRFLSESISSSKNLSCQEFLEKIKDMTEPIAMSMSEGENTVKLMTIHASKGLEFPVVIVADCDVKFNITDENENVLIDSDFGIAPKVYDIQNMTESETVLRTLIKAKMRSYVPQDQMRLFYVALTRAKYNLHLVTSTPKTKGGLFGVKTALKFSDFIDGNDLNTINYQKADLISESYTHTPKNILITKPDEKLKEIIQNRFYSEYKNKQSVYLPKKTSVTAIMKANQSDKKYNISDFFGGSDAEKGTAYHKFLQYADFSMNSDIKTQKQNLFDSGKIDLKTFNILDDKKLESILNIQALKNLKGKQLLREQEFLMQIEADKIFDTSSSDMILVQGIIDMIAMDNSGVEIIDYKLSALKNEADLIDKYQKQLLLYKFAAQKIMKRKVNKLTIINILSEKVINIDINGKI